MKLKYLKTLFLILLIITFGIQGLYILSEELTFTFIQKCILAMTQTILIIVFCYCQSYQKEPEIKKDWFYYTHVMIFILYLFNLLYVLLLDKDFGRTTDLLTGYENINLELFKTIRLFIHGYEIGAVSHITFLINIIGNLCVFMPMAYFLPFFFNCQRKWYIFLITISLMVLGVEILQVIIQVGTGDIDDWILNVVGAIIFYIVLKILPIHYLKESKQ